MKNEADEFLQSLTEEDKKLLLRTIRTPPEPNEKMKKAVQDYYERKNRSDAKESIPNDQGAG